MILLLHEVSFLRATLLGFQPLPDHQELSSTYYPWQPLSTLKLLLPHVHHSHILISFNFTDLQPQALLLYPSYPLDLKSIDARFSMETMETIFLVVAARNFSSLIEMISSFRCPWTLSSRFSYVDQLQGLVHGYC